MFILAVVLLLAGAVLFVAAGCGAGGPRFVPQWLGAAVVTLAALALLVASHVALR